MPVAKDIVSKFVMLSSVFSQSMAEENVITNEALNTTVVEPTDQEGFLTKQHHPIVESSVVVGLENRGDQNYYGPLYIG